MSGLRVNLITKNPFRVFLFFFASTLTVGFFLQLLLLPVLFPSLHAGNGLLLGHDSVNTHARILSLLPQIQALGIKALIPFSSMDYYYYIVGFFYLAISPNPFVILPLNCLMISFGALFLYLFLNKYSQKPEHALIATLPLVLLPSSLGLYTQLQRDCFVIAGVSGTLWAWNHILDKLRRQTIPEISSQLTLIASLYVVYLFRGYLLPAIIGFLFITFITVALFTFIKESPVKRYHWLLQSTAFMIFLTLLFSSLRNPEIRVSLKNHEQMDQEIANKPNYSPTLDWYKTDWLPPFVEEKAMSLQRTRKGFLFESSFGSFNLDEGVEFHRFADIVSYLPRSLQLSLFAPFPAHWFQNAKSSTGSLFRKAMVVEMIFLYLCTIGCLLLLIKKNDLSLNLTIICAILPVILYPLVVINLGTLYRLRFPWIVFIYAFGFLQGLSTIKPFTKLMFRS